MRELASLCDGEVIGDGDISVSGVSEIQNGKPGTITFVANPKYREFLSTTAATAVVVPDAKLLQGKPGIVVKNPQLSIARILGQFSPKRSIRPGIHPSAVIDSTAKIGNQVTIGPWVSVGPDSRIGDNCILHSRVTVGDRCTLGDNTEIFPGVILYPRTSLGKDCRIHAGTVIGSDGFGFVTDNDVHIKIPQNGGVTIGDRVEVGANCAIDRGTISDTTIGDDTKIDNLVHIAHNVTVGCGCLITAQVAFAGSVKIGDFCIFAGQSGVAPHLKVGDRAVIAAKSGVTKSLEPGKVYAGMPAREIREQNRRDALPRQMESFKHRLEKLESTLTQQAHETKSTNH
ncbi:MAG: UDP-3-O-(3-hydroxymyristoyl)glucosamine N-acyltransferase [FCB group bacterium]|nr:UDP-3-O-(3-hydroxymyristoyl)glucosamine N-acyltransferase [FCB group bacterium]